MTGNEIMDMPATMPLARLRIPGMSFKTAMILPGLAGLGFFSLAATSLATEGAAAGLFGWPGLAGSEWSAIAVSTAVVAACGTLFAVANERMPFRHVEFTSQKPVETAKADLADLLAGIRHTGAKVTVRVGTGRTNRYVLETRMPRSEDPTGRRLYDRIEDLGFDVWGA